LPLPFDHLRPRYLPALLVQVVIVVLRQGSQMLGKSEVNATVEGLVPWFAKGVGSREGKLVIVCNLEHSSLATYSAPVKRREYVASASPIFSSSLSATYDCYYVDCAQANWPLQHVHGVGESES
jgi:hypothetical protein